MATRKRNPIRRTAREEARVWPAAIVLVSLYLIGAHWLENHNAATDASSTSGHWQTKGDEE